MSFFFLWGCSTIFVDGALKGFEKECKGGCNWLVNIVSSTLYQIMSKMEEPGSVFQQLRNNKPLLKLGHFLKEKIKAKSNKKRKTSSRKSRWTFGIMQKKRNDYHSPINKLRRQQTRKWSQGGVYSSNKPRKSKRVLQAKQSDSKKSIGSNSKPFALPLV